MRTKIMSLCKKHGLNDLCNYIKNNRSEAKMLYELKNHKGDNLVNLLMELDDDDLKLHYCTDIEDNDKLWKSFKSDEAKFFYCKAVIDREELWSSITEDKW